MPSARPEPPRERKTTEREAISVQAELLIRSRTMHLGS